VSKRYQLTLTEAQLLTVQNALDMYFRVGMGQLQEVTEHLIPPGKPTDEWCYIRDTVEGLFRIAKVTAMPELHPNAYYGIAAPEICDSNRVASDIHKVIRHHRAWEREPQGSWTVDFDAPELRKLSEEPLPVIITIPKQE
jgi:hypothetical protein